MSRETPRQPEEEESWWEDNRDDIFNIEFTLEKIGKYYRDMPGTIKGWLSNIGKKHDDPNLLAASGTQAEKLILFDEFLKYLSLQPEFRNKQQLTLGAMTSFLREHIGRIRAGLAPWTLLEEFVEQIVHLYETQYGLPYSVAQDDEFLEFWSDPELGEDYLENSSEDENIRNFLKEKILADIEGT